MTVFSLAIVGTKLGGLFLGDAMRQRLWEGRVRAAAMPPPRLPCLLLLPAWRVPTVVILPPFLLLRTQILELGITHCCTLEGLVDQIVDKATREEESGEACAQLCSILAYARDSDDQLLLPRFDRPEGSPLDFRRLLLNKCQKEFEMRLGQPGVAAEEGTVEAERQAHCHMPGILLFIGQLYRFGLLTDKIAHNCVWVLLKVSVESRFEWVWEGAEG